MRVVSGMLAVAIFFSLGGCSRQGGNGSGANETGGNGPANGAETTGPARDDGRAEAAMPGGLPAYPGMIAGSRVDDAGVAPGGEVLDSVMFRTADRPEQVVAFYAAAGDRAGLNVLQRRAGGVTLANREISIDIETITGPDGLTSVGISTRQVLPR